MSRGPLVRAASALALGLLLSACAIVGDGAETAMPGEAFSCIGVPNETCQQTLRDARTNADPGTVVVALRIMCTKVPCTPQQGEASVDVGYSNGRRDAYSMGWAGAAPEPALPVEPPPLPVEPACGGVPAETCQDLASVAIDSLDPSAVVTITLSCPDGCDPEGDTGTTVVTLSDGTSTSVGWTFD